MNYSDEQIEQLINEYVASESFKSKMKPQDQSAFSLACSFHLGGHRNAQNEKNDDGSETSLMAPSIVSYVFAVELYLKSLLIAAEQEKKEKSGHDVKQLFDNLKDNERDFISEKYLNLFGRDALQLEKDLEAFSRTFQDTRYLYDYGKRAVKFNQLKNIAITLFLSIAELKPDWPINSNTMARLETGHFSQGVEEVIWFGDNRSIRIKIISG